MTSTRCDAWTDFELAQLYLFVNEEDWLDDACEAIPTRSRSAIAVRMCALRKEAEIIPRNGGRRGHYGQRSLRAQAEDSNRKHALALLALDEAAAPGLSEHDRREANTLTLVQDELIDARVEVQLAFFDGPLFEWAMAA